VPRSRPRPQPAAAPRSCPCGLAASYPECCGRFHRDAESAAPTAELLIRSRYSAYAVRDTAYLLRTWHASDRPEHLDLDRGQAWTRLEILGTSGGGPFHAEGTVEFRAHYAMRTGPGVLHENSRFVRLDGRWVYAGVVTP
jgi:SEC-C motif-containing protein